MKPSSERNTAGVWLLTGNRLGEIAQQRILGAATALPVHELQIARQKAVGGRARHNRFNFQPPWPAIAMSFGQTLPAALAVRAVSGGTTRVVHLGRPGGWVKSAELDLVIPMPQDGVAPAPNVLEIRMPFNWPPDAGDLSAQSSQALAELPYPCTAFIVGGSTRQLHFSKRELVHVTRSVNARVQARRGSLLISTSPRTPANVIPALHSLIDVPGEFYTFQPNDPHNPLRTYLQMADEVIVTGDSASMVAECWRTGKPLLVAACGYRFGQKFRSALHRRLPRVRKRLGYVQAHFDVNGWLQRLADEGHIGLLGRSEPWRPYSAEDDDDLEHAVERIHALIGMV